MARITKDTPKHGSVFAAVKAHTMEYKARQENLARARQVFWALQELKSNPDTQDEYQEFCSLLREMVAQEKAGCKHETP